DGEEDQVQPPDVGQAVVDRHRAPDPEGQEQQDADRGDEAAGPGAHQRLLRNRKKAARQTTAANIDQATQVQALSVATAKTRIARKAPQPAPTAATRMVPPRPRPPVSRSAIQARTRAPTTAMAISAYGATGAPSEWCDALASKATRSCRAGGAYRPGRPTCKATVYRGERQASNEAFRESGSKPRGRAVAVLQ